MLIHLGYVIWRLSSNNELYLTKKKKKRKKIKRDVPITSAHVCVLVVTLFLQHKHKVFWLNSLVVFIKTIHKPWSLLLNGLYQVCSFYFIAVIVTEP